MRRPFVAITLSLVGALGCGASRGTPPNIAEVSSDRPMAVAVSAEGLPGHLDAAVPSEVTELAREGRPRAIQPAFTASAGAVSGARVFWVGYVTGPFLELRARAVDEGRGDAFDDELDALMTACEENDDSSCAGDYCVSPCWESVPNGLASTDRQLLVVRVSWPAGGQPVVDGSTALWFGDADDTTTAQVRAVEDIDNDGRPELVVDVETGTEWPAGDGGSNTRMVHYVDGDTLDRQLRLLDLYEEDGHGGALTQRTEVTRTDANADGVDDFDVHYVTEVMLQECYGYPTEEDIADGAEPEPVPAQCVPADERYRAVYSAARDAWLLPAGQRWPWEAR